MADNRGAQLLRAVLQTLRQSDLAERTAMSQSHISRLSRAEITPALRSQALALEREAGIPIEAWDEPPVADGDAA